MSSEASPRAARASIDAGPLLVVITGPSGVGKDALLARLKERGIPAHFAATATTRPPRNGEEREFLTFLTEQEFDRLLAADGLLEHALVYGHRYGVPKAGVREALAHGRDVILRVDLQGAATIKQTAPGALVIFLAPPSLTELEERLRKRGRDEPATIARRLHEAERELAELPRFDHVVVNEQGQLDEAADAVLGLMEAERSRAGRTPIAL